MRHTASCKTSLRGLRAYPAEWESVLLSIEYRVFPAQKGVIALLELVFIDVSLVTRVKRSRLITRDGRRFNKIFDIEKFAGCQKLHLLEFDERVTLDKFYMKLQGLVIII